MKLFEGKENGGCIWSLYQYLNCFGNWHVFLKKWLEVSGEVSAMQYKHKRHWFCAYRPRSVQGWVRYRCSWRKPAGQDVWGGTGIPRGDSGNRGRATVASSGDGTSIPGVKWNDPWEDPGSGIWVGGSRGETTTQTAFWWDGDRVRDSSAGTRPAEGGRRYSSKLDWTSVLQMYPFCCQNGLHYLQFPP